VSEAASLEPGFFERVYRAVSRIPPGRVSSYGEVSRMVNGRASGARTVGWALGALPELRVDEVPWWRVLRADGSLGLGRDPEAAAEQRSRLEAEGLGFDAAGRIDIERFGWP
jgi:methylated-DNA-protein-cysteine methyltransferase-like protein